MKTEEEMIAALNQAMLNAVRSESLEQLRFYQGKIEAFEWWFAKPEETKDGFEGERVEKKD